MRWQVTIACSPLINCWNDTPAHKQCIILRASETLQSAIVGAKYASTYHSKQVESAVGYWVCCGWKEEGCVWHVNSNQGSDIHQAPWPTVRINLGREVSQALFFVSASICRHLSHFSLRSLSLSSCFLLFIHLPLTLLSHTLFQPLSGCLFSPLPTPLYAFSFFLCFCLSSSCNKSALLFGGWLWRMWSTVINAHWREGGWGGEVRSYPQYDRWICCMNALTEIQWDGHMSMCAYEITLKCQKGMHSCIHTDI